VPSGLRVFLSFESQLEIEAIGLWLDRYRRSESWFASRVSVAVGFEYLKQLGKADMSFHPDNLGCPLATCVLGV
jgi:hypothetical protein